MHAEESFHGTVESVHWHAVISSQSYEIEYKDKKRGTPSFRNFVFAIKSEYNTHTHTHTHTHTILDEFKKKIKSKSHA